MRQIDFNSSKAFYPRGYGHPDRLFAVNPAMDRNNLETLLSCSLGWLEQVFTRGIENSEGVDADECWVASIVVQALQAAINTCLSNGTIPEQDKPQPGGAA